MPFTSNCDFYVAIYDAGINRVVRHVMTQRPSLFNYGTALLAADPQLLCAPIQVDPAVTAAGNPIITVLPPLPVLSTPYGLNYCVQATDGEIDFYPGNVITLPAALNPPLPAQQLALHFRVCAGIGCPSPRRLGVGPGGIGLPIGKTAPSMISRASKTSAVGLQGSGRQSARPTVEGRVPADPIVTSIGGVGGISTGQGQGITVLPTRELDCFCLDLYATAGCTITGMTGNQTITPVVDGINIGGLQPAGLEESIVCYAKIALNDGILPQLGATASQLAFGLFTLPQGMGDIQVSASTTVPNNPAIQDDQLETFIDLDKIDLNVTVGGSGGGGGGGGGGTVTRTTRSRTRTGTFDLTAAVSADAFTKIFGAFMKGFKLNTSGSGSYGPFSVSYDVAAHLEGGSIQLTNSGGVELKDMIIRWDTLALTIGFTLPNICTPSFCIVPIPFDGCAVEVPAACVFSTPPELSLTIDLGGFLDSKVTVTGNPKVFYGVGSGVTNRWQIAVEPTLPILIDIVDLADTAGDLFNTLITGAIDSLISGLPQWAQDLINDILGGVDDIIRTVLGIPDDIVEWLMDLVSSLGIFQDLADALAQYISITVFEVDDPFLALPADATHIPVMLPIQYLGITVNTSEMVVQGDIGD